MDSRWVRAEATIAERNGTLVPVRIEPCDLPVMFELTQTADLTLWQGGADDWAWLAFLGDVRRMVGKDAPVTEAAAPATESAGPGAPANVAVLPIALRGSGEEMEFLAEDLTEDITRKLAQHDYYKVIAASTVAAWRGKALGNRQLGKELDARYLVEGRLQQAGENVRLTVQVIETDHGNALWSQRFAGKPEDLEANPEEFAETVAEALRDEIFATEMNRAMASPGPHSGWEHLLRARAYSSRSGTASARLEEEEARKAVAAAPDLGMAHAMLATAIMNNTTARGARRNDELRRELLAHSQRALQLDGGNPTVLVYASICNGGIGGGETALRLARRAVELRPGYGHAQVALGGAYLMLGRSDDAITTLAPLLHSSGRDMAIQHCFAYLGWSYLLEGTLEDAEDALDRALSLDPDQEIALRFKAIVAARLGKEASALATIRRLREVEPDVPVDRHIRFMRQNPHFREKMAEHLETFRRLWDATEGEG